MKFERRQTGFTLIEVLLVVVIMAIITTGAFSGMLNLQRTSRINTAYRQFSNFFELARSYSLNGKMVDCDGGKQCVPKSFGVIVQQDPKACTAAPSFSAKLFFQKINAQGFGTNDIVFMDSFCINPKVDLWYALDNSIIAQYAKGITFSYAPPFGTFSVKDQSTTPKPATLTFCELVANPKSCDSKNYNKVITLYTNVGVLE